MLTPFGRFYEYINIGILEIGIYVYITKFWLLSMFWLPFAWIEKCKKNYQNDQNVEHVEYV